LLKSLLGYYYLVKKRKLIFSIFPELSMVVFVMTPWDDPVPLQRSWCLFEMFSSIVVQADMHVVIPAAQHAAFKQAVARQQLRCHHGYAGETGRAASDSQQRGRPAANL
jgi:hypothetical protein